MTLSLACHPPLRASLAALMLLLATLALPAAPIQAQEAPRRLHGRVETHDGRVIEGVLRIGAYGAARGDRLGGRLADGRLVPDDDPRLSSILAEARAAAARTLEFSGTRLTWDVDGSDWDRDRLSVPWGLVAEIRPEARGDTTLLVLRSGLELPVELDAARLDPEGADSAMVVIEAGAGDPVQVRWQEVARIVLDDSRSVRGPGGDDAQEQRLVGTVEDRDGRRWPGLLTLSGSRVIALDTLGVGGGARNGAGSRAVRVGDPGLGEVFVPGSRVRSLEVGGLGLADMPALPAADEPIVGRVQLRDGTSLQGRLIWDADEAFAWQTLDGRVGALRVSVAFDRIARIRPHDRDGSDVLLRDGRLLTLRGTNDVDRRNAGVLVVDDAIGARLVEWGEVAEVVFEGGDGVAMPEPAEPVENETPHVPVAEAYDDDAAARLHAAATARWREADTTVLRYTAVVKQRTEASLRTPLRDRTLFRSESASRVFWDRDHAPIVQVLGSRAEYPGRETAVQEGDLAPLEDFVLGNVFDPGGERLFFGFTDGRGDGDGDAFDPEDGTFWIAHPLAPGADTLYRFASRDTVTLRLPDGRALSSVRLDVMPRVADPHRVSATLWVEAETGALVRAAYRLSETFDLIREIDAAREAFDGGPLGLFGGAITPWTLDLDLLVIDYSLWDFRIWMPRSFRFEGRLAFGVVRLPVRFDLAYGIESVVTRDEVLSAAAAADSASVRVSTRGEAMAELARLVSRESGVEYARYGDLADDGLARSGRYLIPSDPGRLATSPELPAPIGTRSPGFLSEADAARLLEDLAEVPRPPLGTRWQGGLGLWRYNRIEGNAFGARAVVTTDAVRVGGAPLELGATAFVGLADLEPKARLSAGFGMQRARVTFGAFRELRAVEPLGRPLGFGNSFNAALFGRDDGEYFLATGVDVELRPPDAARPDLRVRLHAERHHRVARDTRFALVPWIGGDDAFRPNVAADRIDEAGAEVTWSPWWGAGVGASGFGLELLAQGAATRTRGADAESNAYARARLTLRGALALAGGWRLGLEGAAGQGWGALPRQREWMIGGPATLRGYAGAAAIGPTMGRGRLEVGRGADGGSWALFGDAGWAGEAGAFASGDVLWAVGVGSSILEGLVRIDLSRGLTGVPARQWRLDLYVDGIL